MTEQDLIDHHARHGEYPEEIEEFRAEEEREARAKTYTPDQLIAAAREAAKGQRRVGSPAVSVLLEKLADALTASDDISRRLADRIRQLT